jgi:hypothetical protein
MYAYINGMLQLALGIPGSTGNVSRVLLWDENSTVLWDDIYVERTPADITPPVVSINDPSFMLDTTTMDSGDCTLTVVAIDNALNSNWTAIIVDVNKLPVANFTYSPENPTIGIITVYPPLTISDVGSPVNPYPGIFGTHNDTIKALSTLSKILFKINFYIKISSKV